jgi:hypothetical protein
MVFGLKELCKLYTVFERIKVGGRRPCCYSGLSFEPDFLPPKQKEKEKLSNKSF